MSKAIGGVLATGQLDDRITLRVPAAHEQALKNLPYPNLSLAIRKAAHEYLTDELDDLTFRPDAGRRDPLADADTSVRVTIRLSSNLLADIETYAENSPAPHRSNVLRLAIHRLLSRENPR